MSSSRSSNRRQPDAAPVPPARAGLPALRRPATCLLLALILLGSACRREEPPAAVEDVIAPSSYRELESHFLAANYHLELLHEGVPRLLVEQLPEDLAEIPSVSEKKRLFVQSLLPMILIANERIASDRSRAEELYATLERGNTLAAEDRQWLAQLEEKYGVETGMVRDAAARRALLRRVDTLPVSLVLAQAASESGWGTSRFAREGNNLFGERSPAPANGLIPRDRPAGERYEVRRFATVYDSLESYMLNLNTHPAYRELRDIRERLRRAGKKVRGPDLVPGIVRYSVRGPAYVDEIETIIHHNRFTLLADATLR